MIYCTMLRLTVYSSVVLLLLTTTRPVWARGRTSPDFSPSSYQYSPPKISHHAAENDPINMGTTLVAMKYAGGVVVGADTRTSAGTYVSNKLAYKINTILSTSLPPLDSDDEDDTPSFSTSCVICRSGSAADTQWVATQTRHKFLKRQLQRSHSYVPTVSELAHYMRYLVRTHQSSEPLQASLICAGYDDTSSSSSSSSTTECSGGGGGCGKIYAITPGGSLLEEEHFCVSGSGSTLLLGYLDSLNVTDFANYNKDEAIALVTKLLKLSIARDGSSGGMVRIVVVSKEGVEELTIRPDDEKRRSDDKGPALKGFADPMVPAKP